MQSVAKHLYRSSNQCQCDEAGKMLRYALHDRSEELKN